MRESPKLFFARRSAMPGDYAIIVTAAVSQQERLRRTQDNPRFGVGPPALVLRHRASAVVETAGSPRRRLFLVLLVAPIDVALNPAAGLSHSAARLAGPWAGISLRAPSKEPRRRCSAAASRRRRVARPSRSPMKHGRGPCSAGSPAMRSSQSRRGRTVYPQKRPKIKSLAAHGGRRVNKSQWKWCSCVSQVKLSG
jgi:hypothetical protein